MWSAVFGHLLTDLQQCRWMLLQEQGVHVTAQLIKWGLWGMSCQFHLVHQQRQFLLANNKPLSWMQHCSSDDIFHKPHKMLEKEYQCLSSHPQTLRSLYFVKQEVQIVVFTLFGADSVHCANGWRFKYTGMTGNCSPTFSATPNFLTFDPCV